MDDVVLPFEAIVFDLDGVVTQTAHLHFQAWKQTFDEYLRFKEKENFKEFTEKDYLEYVDGRPRYDGVKTFLSSRGIQISWGEPSDSSGEETICGLGNKKNAIFKNLLESKGAKKYPTTVELIKRLKERGVKIGVASSSKNCRAILNSTQIINLFDTYVDGIVSQQFSLKGKPEPDIFLLASKNLEASPSKTVVVEDANSGVEAGRNGGFGLVIGVARKNNKESLLNFGADIAVSDLKFIDIEWITEWFRKSPFYLFDFWDKGTKEELEEVFKKNEDMVLNSWYFLSFKDALSSRKKLAFFFDYDGTLTPIVKRPELAVLSTQMRSLIEKIAKKYPTAIVSGREREDVEKLVGVEDIYYVGSHGFDIKGRNLSHIHPQAKEVVPLISRIAEEFSTKLKDIKGVIVENKKFSVALHYRLVEERFLNKVKEVVDKVKAEYPNLRLMCGKKVFEFIPDIDWDKGKAIRWLLSILDISWREYAVIYIGDDTTDEDAFRMVRTRGIGILVSESRIPSAADYFVHSPQEVRELLEKFI
ncbi:MAG: trehalose-phosphatase [Candidatus Omnitrophota bacterium]|nr:MAG: trehalose-phosphatase [Candidatus Omnitrophota bacterium]HDN85777.1 trehalose-phosphatase [Candidatus Omnitrophota bacterium]